MGLEMNESTVKYLSGLFDADGSVSFYFRQHGEKTYVSLVLQIAQADAKVFDGLGFGSVTACRQYWQWRVTTKSELEMLIPRLAKHCVIKGSHLTRMLAKWREMRGTEVSDPDSLKEWSKQSRRMAGPVHEKKHPTWAWIAGYLDGDGWYRRRYSSQDNYWSMHVGAVAHPGDRVGLDLLQKAFGGNITPHGQSIALKWVRNLGARDSSFALRFLPQVRRHARIKGHKIEQLIHHHRQRLSEETAMAEATV